MAFQLHLPAFTHDNEILFELRLCSNYKCAERMVDKYSDDKESNVHKKNEEKEDEIVFRRCSQCMAAHYCSRECQIEDWSFHEEYCDAENEPRSTAKIRRTARAYSFPNVLHVIYISLPLYTPLTEPTFIAKYRDVAAACYDGERDGVLYEKTYKLISAKLAEFSKMKNLAVIHLDTFWYIVRRRVARAPIEDVVEKVARVVKKKKKKPAPPAAIAPTATAEWATLVEMSKNIEDELD